MNDNKLSPSFDSNRRVLGKVLPLRTPFNIIIDSSEACNFHCSYCFRNIQDKSLWGYAKNAKSMEWNLFEKIVDQVQEFPEEVSQISLSGHGEPLCNKKLPEMVHYIKSKGIKSRISIHTNASLLDEEKILALAQSKIDRIVVSLQGLNSQKYKEVCGFDIDFDEFYSHLKFLYNSKINTKIFIKIIDVALNEGEETSFFEKFTSIADRVFIEKAVPIWKTNNKKDENQKIYNKYGKEFTKQQCCPLMFHTLLVDPIGDVYPCTQLLSKEIIGNIKNRTLKQCWDSEQRSKLLRQQLQLENPLLCKECYILQNSIYTDDDMIDNYRNEILQRM